MASLCNIRSVVICLIAFAGFLRFDELGKLVRSDVEIKSDMLKYFSNLVKLIRTGMVLRLLYLASNLPGSFDAPIFRKGVASPSQPSPSFFSVIEN